jgi:hypothetical protein
MQAESGFAQVVLAEGEELSSNPLRFVFNELQSTLFAVDVDWRILGLCRRFTAVYFRYVLRAACGDETSGTG